MSSLVQGCKALADREGAAQVRDPSLGEWFIFFPCCLKSLCSVFPRSGIAASATCLRLYCPACACLVHSLSCSPLPEVLLIQPVFPQLLLSYPLAHITLHCSYLGLIPLPTVNPYRGETLGPHLSL